MSQLLRLGPPFGPQPRIRTDSVNFTPMLRDAKAVGLPNPKAQAFVIGLVPVPMVLGIHAMDPKFFVPLGETFTGHLIIGAAGVLWLMAGLLARKILAVDV